MRIKAQINEVNECHRVFWETENCMSWFINSAVKAILVVKHLVVDWRRITSLSGSILLRVFACSAIVERT